MYSQQINWTPNVGMPSGLFAKLKAPFAPDLVRAALSTVLAQGAFLRCIEHRLQSSNRNSLHPEAIYHASRRRNYQDPPARHVQQGLSNHLLGVPKSRCPGDVLMVNGNLNDNGAISQTIICASSDPVRDRICFVRTNSNPCAIKQGAMWPDSLVERCTVR